MPPEQMSLPPSKGWPQHTAHPTMAASGLCCSEHWMSPCPLAHARFFSCSVCCWFAAWVLRPKYTPRNNLAPRPRGALPRPAWPCNAAALKKAVPSANAASSANAEAALTLAHASATHIEDGKLPPPFGHPANAAAHPAHCVSS